MKRRIKRTLEIKPDFRDLDLMGFVHNSVYFLWFERGRMQILDDIVTAEDALRLGVAVVVVENKCEYFTPVTRADELTLVTTHEADAEYGGALRFCGDLYNLKTKVHHAHGECKCSIVDLKSKKLLREIDAGILERYGNLK